MSASVGSRKAICNICGGKQFEFGPNNRKSSTGELPRCTQCQSLERHRQLRQIYTQFPREYLAKLQVLQLSPDIGVEPSWFGSYEVSVFQGENSLDLHSIDRRDASYDLVICNHVLEHVADDRRGLHELMRITRPHGFLQITVPTPYTRDKTVDWGYARPESHGHYRGYGRDFLNLFSHMRPDAGALEVEAFDDVTGAGGYVYLWSRDNGLIHMMQDWIANPIVSA
ncbi:MAG: class I SAM-dependent methyltransferase [Acidiferrobacterales bacterium]